MNIKNIFIAILIAIALSAAIVLCVDAEMKEDEWTVDDELLMAFLDQDGLTDEGTMEKILDGMNMDYASLMDGANPDIKKSITEALAEAGITEIYILDNRGIKQLNLALNHLQDRWFNSSKKPDVNTLGQFIGANSVNSKISCMDLGTVIMQYIINGR